MTTLRDALFTPRRIALIGASAEAGKVAARPHRYLRKHGFAGEILPINPRRDEIDGLPCYPSLAAVPSPVDHAYILVATERVVDAVKDCAAKGVACASILAGGFADAGETGCERQRELIGISREAGIRLLGPNSMGVVNTGAGLVLSTNAVFDIDRLLPGRLSVVSQSGSLMGAILARGQARGIGFSKMVSVGNEADLAVGDVIDLLADDPATDAILLFIEALRGRDAFARAARRAHEAGKPIIAYKLGRSEAGRELAVSHTGAIAGSDAALEAFLRGCGVARVNVFEALIEAPPLFIGRSPAPRRRVSVMTTTGGGGAMVVDCLGALGVDVAGPSPALQAQLARHGIRAGDSRLVDLTLVGTRPEIVGAAVETLLGSEDSDAVVMVVGSSAQFHPQLAVAPLTGWKASPKPLAAFLVPDAEASLKLLAEAGIAGFRTAESCADALAAFLRWPAPAGLPTSATGPVERAARLVGEAPHRVLDERRSHEVLEALGIPGPAAVLLREGDDPATAGRLGFPLVAKIVSPAIPHKTEAGGIVVGIAGVRALVDAYDTIRRRVRAARPDAPIEGILVQRQEAGLAEAIVGFRRDPVAGPIVTVGLGGVLAELYADLSVRTAPVDLAEARAMIGEVRGLAPIRGWRGLPKGDVDALAATVAALSQLAHVEAVQEAEINPLIVRCEGEGVAAVDGLVVRA